MWLNYRVFINLNVKEEHKIYMKKKNKQHKKHQSKRKGGTQNYMNQNYMNKKNKVYVWLKGRNLEARGADGFIIHICGG